ncbi:MAG: phosphoribosylamine--glycine ligase [Oscillospiraceae bacterium]|nr:phosphoribosylamine--glycine ligase [Oscillospiraceae bacterium]
MNILVVGGGGREHAICASLRRSPRVEKLWCAPGNGGISAIAQCVDIAATDVERMVGFAKAESVDLVVVAPDDPLAIGMVDALEAAGIRAFGPRKNAAAIESSKAFAKELMQKYGIPTARYAVFDDGSEAKSYIVRHGAPIVVKADGLALGKGVVVALDVDTAIEAIDSMMLDKKFGESGNRVVIEEVMTGPEVTVLAFTDGKTIIPMLSSQDHKRARTGDLGPNTGGMGAFCPAPNYTDDVAETCIKTIFQPTIDAMRSEGRPFKGVIYFGLMLTPGGPRVIEYNARFGDPEAQPVLALLKTDLLEIFDAIIDEKLGEVDIEWHEGFACCVIMASKGYPEKYDTGFLIEGLESLPDGVEAMHAGTLRTPEGYVTNGGRVLGITARGGTLREAAERAYEGAGRVRFENAYYRTDIG